MFPDTSSCSPEALGWLHAADDVAARAGPWARVSCPVSRIHVAPSYGSVGSSCEAGHCVFTQACGQRKRKMSPGKGRALEQALLPRVPRTFPTELLHEPNLNAANQEPDICPHWTSSILGTRWPATDRSFGGSCLFLLSKLQLSG